LHSPEASDDLIPYRLKLWLNSAFGLADAAACLAAKRRARDQFLTFVGCPGQVGATNDAWERDLRPAVI
jgi:transposase